MDVEAVDLMSISVGEQAKESRAVACGWFVIMACDKAGHPIRGRRAHKGSSPPCYVLEQEHQVGPDSDVGDFLAVPVEEVPGDTKPCGHCGGGVLRRWRAGARP